MTKCEKCKARIEGHVHSEEQMAHYCKECKRLKRMASPGMVVMPVYTLEAIVKASKNGTPILTRNGMMLP